MKYALINPRWTFDGSIYFGCREPHLPLEYGYAKALLERAGHEAIVVDGQIGDLDHEAIARELAAYRPDVIVVTTAPSYLFWRCAPPELRVPQELLGALGDLPGLRVVVGPHASATPAATLRKLGADVAILGECEDLLPLIAAFPERRSQLPSIAYRAGDDVCVQGGMHATDVAALPALRWPPDTISRHRHHHHRFDSAPQGPGAEMEVSRGCPYHCAFCAKDNFRNQYRKRPLSTIFEEVDRHAASGVEYIYFIDEIFLPDRALLEGLVERPVRFGVQTRIDLWSREMLALLGRAGCVSIEAGVESISVAGRNLLHKQSRLSTEEIAERLVFAREHVPFVQANLLDARVDDPEAIEAWRQQLIAHGVWANRPVPMFAYPGSPDYTMRWGPPDDQAWERAVDDYLRSFTTFSDIQEQRPLPLHQLEHPVAHAARR